MEELDLVVEPDSDLNKELAPYPLPLTYCETAFMLNMNNISERVTKYGDYCWYVKDIFLDFDLVYDFVRRLPYTYNRDLNNAAYLYRAHWQLPTVFNRHLTTFITEVTDLPTDYKLENTKDSRPIHFTSSFFSKAWYDMHYIDLMPHQDDEGGGLFDLNQELPQNRFVQYVMIVYMNDGLGTSLYTSSEKEYDLQQFAKREVHKMMGRFDFINLETTNNWKELYTEILTSPGHKNSAFIYPANVPHRVSQYKDSTPIGEFEKDGRFYLMHSFNLNFI